VHLARSRSVYIEIPLYGICLKLYKMIMRQVNNLWVCRMPMRSPVGVDSCIVVGKYKSWELGDRGCVDITRQFVLVDYKYAELDVVIDVVLIH
jgi:hypothetical protein